MPRYHIGGAKAQIRIEAASKQSNDPPLSRVNTHGSGEDNMKLMELMEHYTILSELFWTSAKVKTVNEDRQIQALVDKKKVIISETSIRSDLKLDDAEGTDCLPTATIFAELERMGLPGQTSIGNVQAQRGLCYTFPHQEEDMGADLATLTNSHSTPIITQPSSSKPQKKKSIMKQRKDSAPTKPTTEETTPEEHVATPSCDPPQSGKDRMKLIELMNLCTQLQSRVLALETTKSNQALEIESLKRRVKSMLEEREIEFKKVVEEPVVSVAATTKSIPVSATEVVTTASTNVEIPDESTLAQTLIEIKTTKPMPVTTAATTVTSVRSRAKGIIFHDQEEQVSASTKTFSSSQS
ncbi:hypothetical protein Tco_0104983 [Tanacetum coccineum]